jgi:hypothetical protein
MKAFIYNCKPSTEGCVEVRMCLIPECNEELGVKAIGGLIQFRVVCE